MDTGANILVLAVSLPMFVYWLIQTWRIILRRSTPSKPKPPACLFLTTYGA